MKGEFMDLSSVAARLAAVLLFLPALTMSAPAGKVHYALGAVDRKKVSQEMWKPLATGKPVYQSDSVRTGEESTAIFRMNDGSSISIAENTEIKLAQLLVPNNEGGFETQIDIKKGNVNFAVQKQKPNSKFRFRTGTSTASIRGTEGYIGSGDDGGMFFAGLKTGKLDVEGVKQTVSIGMGETVFGNDSLVSMKLASSGDARFAKKLRKILTKKDASIDNLVKEIQQADSLFQEEIKNESSKAGADNNELPTIQFVAYDSIRCSANLAIGGMKNDKGSLSVLANGSPVLQENISKNKQKKIDLQAGKFEYVAVLQDQSGNKAEATSTMGCYPVKRFNIEIMGSKREVLNVPPPPQDMQDRISATLNFKIKLPDNDPESLYKVTVKQNGKVILQESLSQIQNLDYQIPVELTRAINNKFDIEAIHKSGFRARAQKVYEVH
ncbi:FecR family protein [uncultured Fibrobacter sp.]|uniref:FecR family protein n=1 Tax=uncultured Fibrobacter sp. TaxID=261512 RepID=UPI002618AE7B|nr:FecR family protein [uncultured Fibrobacter sp.]